MRTDRSLAGAHNAMKPRFSREYSPTSVRRKPGLRLVTALKWMAALVVLAAAYSVIA